MEQPTQVHGWAVSFREDPGDGLSELSRDAVRGRGGPAGAVPGVLRHRRELLLRWTAGAARPGRRRSGPDRRSRFRRGLSLGLRTPPWRAIIDPVPDPTNMEVLGHG